MLQRGVGAGSLPGACALALTVVVGGAGVIVPAAVHHGGRPVARGEAAIAATQVRPSSLERPPKGVVSRSATERVPSGAANGALVVGINRAPGARPLSEAVRDADMAAEALGRYGFAPGDITELRDAEASAARILSAIDDLAARVAPGGHAVVLLAGHTRIRRGGDHFVAGDGTLISARTLAVHIGRIRAATWIALPTCYAGGYALPGIVGHNRLATFASPAGEMAYELEGLGSWMMLHMVRYAMLDAKAPGSVEQAFGYAERSIRRINRDRTPSMSDGVPGEFVLGPVTWSGPGAARKLAPRTVRRPQVAADKAPEPAPKPQPPPPQPMPGGQLPVEVCLPLSAGCRTP